MRKALRGPHSSRQRGRRGDRYRSRPRSRSHHRSRSRSQLHPPQPSTYQALTAHPTSPSPPCPSPVSSAAALQHCRNKTGYLQFRHIYIMCCCCCCCCCCAGEAPLGKGRGAALLPGRRRILRAAAKQLAAVELLQEQLDVSAVDIDTHCMPPPDAAADSSGSHPLQQQQQQQQQGSEAPTCSSQSRSLELLRLHALLQAAVGTEQDLVVVG